MSTMTASQRPRRTLLFQAGLLGLLLLASTASLVAQDAPEPDPNGGPLQANHDTTLPKPIGNDAILRMTKAGLDESIILGAIDNQPGYYDTSPDALIELKQAGVSARVIQSMQFKASGVPAPKKKTGFSSRTAVVPGPLTPALDEIGVYYKDRSGEWIPLKTERVKFKSGGWLKSTATYGIIKEDRNGEIQGPHSTLEITTGAQLLIYAPEGTAAEEYSFVRFREKSDRREFRVYTGGVFHNESGSDRDAVDFDAHKIAPRLYALTVPNDIGKGDYGILPPGSSNVPGVSGTGKIFTFRIIE